MRYYKALMEMGHMGVGKSREVYLYIYANSILDAMKVAQNTPAIKHSKMPLSIIEISKEEFLKGREEDAYKNAMNGV